MNATPGLEFQAIYDAYHRKVRAWAAKLIGQDEADDVVQEVFVKIGRSLGALEDPAKLSSWVYSITLNTVRDAARRRSARPEATSEPIEGGADGRGPGALGRLRDARRRSPEEAAMVDEMVACYLDYVNQLPPRYREVYALAEFEELANEAIAARLSVSLGTVKIRLHRARARLNEQLRCNCQVYQSEGGELMGEPRKR